MREWDERMELHAWMARLAWCYVGHMLQVVWARHAFGAYCLTDHEAAVDTTDKS